jgi:hypothetical protein
MYFCLLLHTTILFGNLLTRFKKVSIITLSPLYYQEDKIKSERKQMGMKWGEKIINPGYVLFQGMSLEMGDKWLP